jgi:hypothetical protein
MQFQTEFIDMLQQLHFILKNVISIFFSFFFDDIGVEVIKR